MEGSKPGAQLPPPPLAETPFPPTTETPVPQPGPWEKALAYSEIKKYLKTPEDEARFLASLEGSLMDSVGIDRDAPGKPDINAILRLHFLGETFSFTDEDGTEYVWDVTKAKELIAASPRDVVPFVPSEHGITAGHVLSRYPNLEPGRAKTADPSVPVIFIPFAGAHLLIDGWHRLYRAVTEGVSELPCYVLTEEEAQAVLASRTEEGGTTA